MKKSKDLTEEILMKNKSLDELIKLKMQEELKNAFNTRVGNNSKTLITDIKDVPVDKIFTKRATFKVFNKETKVETLVNGLQAEALIGVQNHIRSKMLSGELNAFTTDDAYIKFERAEF